MAVLSRGKLVACGPTDEVLAGADPLALFRGEPIPYERIELPPIEFSVPPGLDGSSPGPGPG